MSSGILGVFARDVVASMRVVLRKGHGPDQIQPGLSTEKKGNGLTIQSDQGPILPSAKVLWQGTISRDGTSPAPVDLPRHCLAAWSRLCEWIQTVPGDQTGVAVVRAGRVRLGVCVGPNCLEGAARVWSKRQFSQADPFAVAPNDPKAAIPSLGHLESLLRGSDSAFYLGAAQALVDGAKVSVQDCATVGGDNPRGPDPIERAANLWRLLPISVRWERTIAVPDPKNLLNGEILSGAAGDLPEVWQAERLGDYPEGRYELSLHEAIDQGDEAMVEKLLKRQSPKQVLLMGFILLIGFIIMGALLGK